MVMDFKSFNLKTVKHILDLDSSTVVIYAAYHFTAAPPLTDAKDTGTG